MAMQSGSGLLEWLAVAVKMKQARGINAGEFVVNGTSMMMRSSRGGMEWTTSLIHAFLNASNSKSEVGGAQKLKSLEESVSELVFEVLENVVGVDMKSPNPITKELPMVSSPVPVLSCICLYLLVVWLWSSHIKSSGQKPRKEDPVALRCLVIAHNLFLCILSAFMAVGLVAAHRFYGYKRIWGNKYDEREPGMNLLIYVFYMSKLYEFMDTAIMLVRRNLRQVTYLHLYHHTSISMIWWILCYRSPGADAYFSAAFNSAIHVAMYFYYLLAAIVGKDEKRRRKYLFWGKYLTIMQMLQFLSFIAQAIYCLYNPEVYPKGVGRMLFFYSCSLLAFFGNFFVNKYRRPKQAKITAKTE
ncbi:hypothetical protein R1flu_005306 [Riccia fluitans]|uniref:Very-long-chain 3-oxoacyl-CoA synthase n=1 Tax=Riccia fluitans TaxID=41844 RepID=A0ABD1YSU0_9MARC